MSVFSKLSKSERAAVFSGNEFGGSNLPSGLIMPDGSVLVCTKEGWNTFRHVGFKPGARGKATYGANALWRCDLALRGDERIRDRAIELKEVVFLG